MKKYILYSFITLVAAFSLAGCGSNAISDDGNGVNTSVLEVIPGKVDKNGLGFRINMPVIKKLDQSVNLKLDNFDLDLNGCSVNAVQVNPDPLLLDGSKGQSKTITVSGQLLQDCTPTSYILYADETITEAGKSKILQRVKLVEALLDVNGNPTATTNTNPSGAEYRLTNPSTPLVINQSNEIKNITVGVVDKLGVGVEGIMVKVTAINDPKYGVIESASSVRTDSSGRAAFSYRSPEDVAAVDGERIYVTLLMDINGTIADQKVVEIEFQKVDQNVTMPIVVIGNNYKEIVLTQNSQNAQIEVQVFERSSNVPYTTGNVRVSLPSKVLDGIDVGSFSQYSVPVGSNGKAVFNYNGPQDLQKLIDNNETNAIFEFYHELNPTQKESVVAIYDLQAGYIPANYILTTSSQDGKQTMNLDTVKTFTLYLKDDLGTLVDDNKINSITIRSQNTIIGKLIDPNDGSEETLLTFNGSDAVNSKSFSVKTNTLSGLLPIKIDIDFTNASGEADQRSFTMNIVVFSGPPTAISISYVGVEQNEAVGKYIEKFAVTVTDAYNNPVNTKPFVATGAIVEYAVDGSSPTGERTTTSPRLWHGTLDPRGTLEAIGGNRAQFTTTSDTFNYVDINNDRLVVFGAGFVYEALGKWDLESVAPQLLELKDDYYGQTRSDLGFAVGHNNRQNLCTTDQREYVGNMKSDSYQIDENGHALIEFEYDYHLTGKDIMVWVNLTGYQSDENLTTRIGEAQKHTLRGNGLIAIPENGYSVPKGQTVLGAKFAIHHENAPEWYINGKFGWAVKSGSTCMWSIDDTSNYVDARTCYGSAYISFTLTAPDDKDCTFAIERVNVSEEFTGVSTH